MSKITFLLATLVILSAVLCVEDKHMLSFLEAQSAVQETEDVLPNTKPAFLSVQEALNFMTGLSNGFGFYSDLPQSVECIAAKIQATEDFSEVINMATDFYSIMQNPKDLLQKVIQKSLNAYLAISNGPCTDWVDHLKKMDNSLRRHAHSKDYMTNLMKHTISNAFSFATKLYASHAAMKARDYNESGKLLGEFLKLAFFWDVTPKFDK
jgi:hypothetical protein